ncbi:MAG TPA: hypothetical protein VGM96_23350 [Reyranella sp.]
MVALAVALAGCASGGNEILKNQDTATVNALIIDNKTTRDEVLRIYGSPTQSSFLNEKNEIFTYRWARATAQGQNFIPIVGAFARAYDVHKKQLVIIFNEQNVVARHTMTDLNDTIKSGLADGGTAPNGRRPDATTMSSIDSNVSGAEGAILVSDDKSEGGVSSPSSSPSTPSTKRNSVGSPAPAASAPPAGSVQPVAAVTRAPARAPGVPPAAGIWECGLHGNNGHTYKLQFVVGSDRSIIVTNYANAPVTIVRTDPLTVTANNPRGDRPMNIVWNTDNTMEITGPSSKNQNQTFRDSGACTKV